MILIADSGSTKTSWFLYSKENRGKFLTTGGINPFFRTTVDIVSELKQKLVSEVDENVESIFFYGAGIVNAEKGGILKNAFKELFGVINSEVQSDLLAAARATLGAEEGIACILGTGSNSCLYDGNTIIEHVPPLGFILGDEGSGAVLGRKLLADYLKQIMPEKLASRFSKQFPFEYSEFLDKIYRLEKPNQFLAGFVPFLKENITEEYCRALVENSFSEFISRNISGYSDFEKRKICFVGSVAYHFSRQLTAAMEKKGLKTGTIIRDPLEGLIQFHLNNLA